MKIPLNVTDSSKNFTKTNFNYLNTINFHSKVSKKLQPLATPLTDGYAAHLSILMSHGGSRPAQGNQRMVIPRGCFNLPGHTPAIRRRR